MTLKHMRIFITVYQEMNVTRAAESLHMTQPAVTRAIQEIEGYYGVCLFERMNHRLYRTESGRELYARAIQIMDSFDSLEKEIKNWDELGVLRVGASMTNGNFLLPKAAADFQKEHPKLQLKVTISNGAQLQQAVLDNRIDFALIEGKVSSEYLCTDLLTEDHLRLILPADHPLCKAEKIYLKDLTSYPLLLRENGSSGRDFLNHIFALHGLDIEPAWESVSTNALIKAVACGLGISILPEQFVADAVFTGAVAARKVEEEPFARKNYIVWHKQKHLTKTAREFMDLCHSFICAKQE